MTVSLNSLTPNFTLSSGNKIPAIAYGSGTKWQQIKKGRDEDIRYNTLLEDLVESTSQALKSGFRHLDTAEIYTTHPEIGEAIKRSGIARNEIFLTDKFASFAAPFLRESTGPYQSCLYALEELDVEYLDLYLLHTPELKRNISLEDAWLELEKLLDEGKVKNIGVSNFDVEHLEKIIAIGKYKPVVNQIEFNAYLQEQTPGIIEFCGKNDILIEAYAPLGPLLKGSPGPLDNVLADLATKYNKTQSQILLRWTYQNGILPVTTSSKIERLVDALNIFTFELNDKDFKLITKTEAYTKYDDILKKKLDL
ncbi:hypothetical protein PACTADRAFT_73418 [Pachysolen tannophilus NRRL Y-2460]|uniref:2-dehydropantolactone reductase n=1 Tax=Pachysolen tannophilus NRRL Y-2460 TaxID=669874 RepID=A0A1E4U151_PACTA|nr:hypothetical protein PACTADRAFT_73418 [Pachysolen tannophilus NRRL Y-2460]